MSLSLASLATLHGPPFIIPDEVNDDSYTLDSTLWDSTAFGLNVKVVSNISQYMGSFTIRLNRDNGKWKPAVDLHLKHDHHLQPLRTRHIRSFENISTSEKWTTARQWLESNKPDKFRECINNESNETTKHKQLTQLLKWAIEEGKIQFIDSILNESERSFDSVTIDDQEMGLIILAITNMQSGILKILLNSVKIDKNTDYNRYHQIDGDCWPRLCLTIKYDRLDMTRMLLQQNDDPAKSDLLTNPEKSTPIRNISDQTDDSGIQPQKENKPIDWTTWEYCLYAGKITAFKLLIEYGLAVNAPLATGEQPIHIAAKVNSINAIELLIQHNVDINAQTPLEEKDYKSTTSLADSTEGENANCCPGWYRTMFKKPHRQKDQYLTISQPGISYDKSNLANYKIQFKIVSSGPSTQSNIFSLSFNDSIQKQRTETPEPLSTPLHFAARYRAVQAYLWLTRHGANTDLMNTNGYTATYYLATNERNFAGGVKQPNYFTK